MIKNKLEFSAVRKDLNNVDIEKCWKMSTRGPTTRQVDKFFNDSDAPQTALRLDQTSSCDFEHFSGRRDFSMFFFLIGTLDNAP